MGFSEDNLIPLVDEGLGNSSYLVDLSDGSALAVDASRVFDLSDGPLQKGD